MYQALNYFFLIFHTLLILFNLTGWIWKVTRPWNLITLSATALSWFGLGLWYGLGYCPCTHWHWMVRRKLGLSDMPVSYIKFLIQEWTGIEVAANIVDAGTVVLFVLALVASVSLNIRDYKRMD